MRINLSKNNIICGDNLEWLNWLPDESIDMCYIDPPFFSNRNYEVVWGNGAEMLSFGDRFSLGISKYIEWMTERVSIIHKKLKPTGIIFLHCDWHASHRLRLMLDDIFGESNIRNEIIWKRKSGNVTTLHRFGACTDTILFYSKSKEINLIPQYSYDDPEYNKYVEKFFKLKDENGRIYRLADLSNPAPRPNLMYEYKGYKPPKNGWAISKEKMIQFEKEGRLHFPKNKDGRIQRKRFLDELKGKPVQNLWDDIDPVQPHSSEKIGYPTQKPEALLKRIIECSTAKGDLILDCFGGGGTTAKVSAELGRRFITGDVSPVACRVIAERVQINCPKIKFEIKNLPTTEEEFRKIDGHDFAKMFCEIVGWQVNPKTTADNGIDGWDGNGVPIQIKNQKNKAGRPDVQRFLGALMAEDAKEGKFVSWEFSKEAIEFISEIKQKHKIIIEPVKCKDRLGSLILTPERQLELNLFYEQKTHKQDNLIEIQSHKKKRLNKKAA